MRTDKDSRERQTPEKTGRNGRNGFAVQWNHRALCRRGIALFLACIMLVSALPVQAFSDDGQAEPVQSVQEETPSEGGDTQQPETPKKETDTEDSAIEPSEEGNEDDGSGSDGAEKESDDSALNTDSQQEESEGENPPADQGSEEEKEEQKEEQTQEQTDQPETREAADITNSTALLRLSLEDWWYASKENTAAADSSGRVDFGEFLCEQDAEAGATLRFSADAVSGDWFSVTFPETFTQVQTGEAFVCPDWMRCSLERPEESKNTVLTVTILRGGAVEAGIPLKFRLDAAETAGISLQDDGTNPRVEYTVLMPIPMESLMGISPLAEEDDTAVPTPNTVPEFITISGSITFDGESFEGIDWSRLLRPSEFDQNIRLTAVYGSGEQQGSVVFDAQDSAPSESCYLGLIHNGDGTADFEISNVPTSVTVTEGEETHTYPVSSYQLEIAVDQDALPYYSSNTQTITVSGAASGSTLELSGPLTMNMERRTLTLQATVKDGTGESSGQFPMVITFSNGDRTPVTKTVKTPCSVTVPAGIQFQVKQNTPTGYLLKSYGADGGSNVNTSAGGVTGIAASDVTVSAVNYASNHSESFTVQWVDSNNPSPPELSADNFVLESSTDGENWSVVTGTLTHTAQGEYAFTNLPCAVEAEEELVPLTYRVKLNEENVPEGYTATQEGNVFTFCRKLNFSASMRWIGTPTEAEIEEVKSSLHMYRRITGGAYEPVDVALDVISEGGGNWQLTPVGDWPRYQYVNGEYQEYDYVIVQGSIDENGEITKETVSSYKTYYSNGEGNFGTDFQLCHNGGTIIQYRSQTTPFTAEIQWKDSAEAARSRPAATVTLWRYALSDTEEDPGIDAKFSAHSAARVIYRKSYLENDEIKYKDVLLSYKLEENADKVEFTSNTVPDLPAGYQLPAYDELGRRYVYFVRETLDSDDYAIGYSSGSQGVLSGGTITNTHREKKLVTITKAWRCPANLEDIDGISVGMRLLLPVKDENGEIAGYVPATVYSSAQGSYEVLTDDALAAAQTLGGFTSSISIRELQMYINACDADGQDYDLSQAVVEEIWVKQKDGSQITVTSGVDEDGNYTSTFPMNGNTFTGVTTVEETTDTEGETQYRYRQTNTISGTRNFTINKTWSGFTEEELGSVSQVDFSLRRRSTGDSSATETVQTVTIPNPGPNDSGKTPTTWSTTIEVEGFDENGYAYRYEAVETGVDGGESISWKTSYVHGEDSTTANNYKTTGSNPALGLSKVWDDNGDVNMRKLVTVRIYRKADIVEKLTGRTGEISLDDMGIPYAAYTLSGAGGWYIWPGLKDAETQMGAEISEGMVLNPNDYLALEYSVGTAIDAPEPAVYPIGQLLDAAENKIDTVTGRVWNQNRQYTTQSVKTASGTFMVRNIRTGQIQLTIRKTWKDGGNATGSRPASVSFQLYQDGAKYAYTEGGGVTIQPSESCSATISSTGMVTLTALPDADNSALEWSCTISNLPLYNSSGAPHTYDVDEMAVTAVHQAPSDETEQGMGENPVESDTSEKNTIATLDSGTSGTTEPVETAYYLTQKELPESSTVDDMPDSYLYSYGFTNTITGSTFLNAAVAWKDKAVNGDGRPDIYMTLYRNGVLFTDYRDQVWDTSDPYNWTILVTDLPRFDENGNEYTYTFRETLNNGSQKIIYGYYAYTPEGSMVDDNHQTFTNTLQDTMTISGDKLWLELEKDDPRPPVVIELYRSTTDIGKNLLGDSDIAGLEWVARTTLEQEADGTWTYTFLNQPKFAGGDMRYYYAVREIVQSDAVQGSTENLADLLYVKASVNGTLTNTFRSDVNREIQVYKTWSGRENLVTNEQVYPAITLNLYRISYTLDENNTLTAVNPEKPLKSVTISASAVRANAQSETKTPLYTFENLRTYSPEGYKYDYYITENGINGYTTTYTDEAYITDNEAIADPDSRRCDVISLPDDPFDENANHSVSVSIHNAYTEGKPLILHGEKYWNDYSNNEQIYGGRPDTVQLTLRRYTSTAQDNVNNGASDDARYMVELQSRDSEDPNVTVPYVVWEKGTGEKANSWYYTIYNLERYAPNGETYTYSVTEEILTDTAYQQKTQTVGRNASQATTDDQNRLVLEMPKLTNSFAGSYYVRKNWMDGNNKYGLRPASVTVVLQRSNDGGETWQDVPWAEGLPRAGNLTVVSVTLTAANEIANTKHNSWQYTFNNLPTQDRDGNIWEYHCIETHIGAAAVGDTDNKAGAYTRSYPTQNETKTVIQNKLESTSLFVQKVWLDDNNDMYHSRPESLTFYLQMRGIKDAGASVNTGEGTEDGEEGETELTDWENVQLNGEDFTFTISKNEGWTKTLPDLPVATVGEDGKTYYHLYFRAMEVSDVDGDQILGVYGALNYQDQTDYATESTAHGYDSELNRNVSTITNRLQTNPDLSTITVNKTWYRQPGEEVSAVFELLYKTQNEENWHCYGGKVISDNENWSAHTGGDCVLHTLSSDDAKSESFSWIDLPRYDREGNELEYQVVEHPVAGYQTEWTSGASDDAESVSLFRAFLNLFTAGESDSSVYDTKYIFTNIELQDYTVQKVWQNTDYAEQKDRKFTATFQLQQRIGDGDWAEVPGAAAAALTSTAANDTTQSYTWGNLPKYTADGKQIIYRAVETQINGKPVTGNTNGSYIVTYAYGENGEAEPAFAGTKTIATNRMVYGFVNLSKSAAYLTNTVTADVTADSEKKLAGVVFDIYSVTGVSEMLYASGITTDANGNLTRSTDEEGIVTDNPVGTYGVEQKYLIAGTYTLKETATNPGYSVWNRGVTFNVGANGDNNTGEHGTAWISTQTLPGTELVLWLKADYEYSDAAAHTFGDSCVPKSDGGSAYNLESRGVIRFTKTGENGGALDTHVGASGESAAYFGVYSEEACTNQVAGMMASVQDKTQFVLTNLAQNGGTLSETFDGTENGIPYLRTYDGQVTLLAGTYYIKELVAPPGYKLDTTVRKAKIAVVQTPIAEDQNSAEEQDDLTAAFLNNKAEIMLTDAQHGTTDYKWANTPNQLILYKRDQYGRNVTLKTEDENGNVTVGYLELKVEGDGNTFPTGGNTIQLYQEQNLEPYVTYANDHWTITGLFDIGKTYTISEPEGSVPGSYIQAKPFSFTMNADGSITYQWFDGRAELVSTDNPLGENGTNFENAFRSSTGSNVVVLRDVARFLKDVALEKVIAGTDTPIENISFMLYKYDSDPEDAQPVLTVKNSPAEYLTTNGDGQIVLHEQPDTYTNEITHCALMYGLDVGNYYFQEIERGASDIYRLAGRVYFKIREKDPTDSGKIPTAPEDYEDYAEVIFDTSNGFVTQPETPGKLGVVKNTPVTTKTLALTKVDSANEAAKLAGARFTLTYTSVNDGQNGAQTVDTFDCMTDINGVLRLCGADGAITFDQPNISKKGTYTLVETFAPQTPAGYMTPEDGSTVLLTFVVNSQNQIVENRKFDGWDENGEPKTVETTPSRLVEVVSATDQTLTLTVKNEKTVVSIAKRNDIVGNTKTCDQTNLKGETLSGAVLEIYQGDTLITSNDNPNPDENWTYADGVYTIPAGKLKENIIYTLREKQAPVGYLKADDIYFKLFGTTTRDGYVVSRLYVWTGEGTPSLDGDGWSDGNIRETVLTMVDEAIIAPVDMQKVVGDAESGYHALFGAEFEVKSLDDGTVLGTAVTDSTGYLVWKEVTNPSGLIFNANGKRITESDNVIGQTIILQQNKDGYQFTETYAPDNAYNEGKSFLVKITGKNYTDYRDEGYSSDCYVDILTASKTDAKTVENLTIRDNMPTADDLVNPPYKSTVTLHKYDGESGEALTPLANTEFTLYRVENGVEQLVTDANVPAGETNASGKFTTDDSGDIAIEIHRKGSYILRETQAAPGYICDGEVSFTLTDADYGQSKALKKVHDGVEDAYGVPNTPIHLTVTKIARGEPGTRLEGVQFTLKPVAEETFLNGDQTLSLETDANGMANISGGRLQQGHSYILTETSVGDNTSYRLPTQEAARQIVFTVTAAGTVELAESQTCPDWMVQVDKDNAANLIVANQPISLTVTKRDQTDRNKTLPDAALKLSRKVDDAWVQVEQWTTTADGKTISPIASGEYLLEELQAPDGYNRTSAALTFTIDQAGVITQAGIGDTPLSTENLWFRYTNPQNSDGSIMLDVFNAKFSDLKILKQGSDRVPLSGVQFRLEYMDDTTKSPITAVTDEKGETVFQGLPDGTYRVTEVKTAPGYNLLSAAIEVAISRDSDIYTARFAGEETEAELSRSGDTISLTVVNQKGLALPATGTTTPELPKAVLVWTAVLEGLVLYFYQTHGKRRKKGDGQQD